MKTLENLFRDRSEELRARLERAVRVSDVLDALADGLDAVQQDYVRSLSVPQARVALPVFEAVRHLLDAIRPVVREPAPGERRPEPPPTGSDRESVAFGYLDRFVTRVFGRRGEAPAQPTADAVIRCEPDTVIRPLGRAVAAMDRAVAEVSPPAAARPDLSRETHGELLEFLQNLAADALDGDGSLVLKRVRQLPRVLKAYDLRVESYQPGGQSAGLDPYLIFEFEPSIDPAQRDHVTLVPALVQRESVLLPGRVVAPVERTPEPASEVGP